MASRSVALAKEVVDLLSSTPYVWPWLDTFTQPNPAPGSPWLLPDEATVKTVIVPQVKRVEVGKLHVLVAPSAERQVSEDFKDRCGRKWLYPIDVGLVQRFSQEDSDEIQPGTLNELDLLFEMSETMATFFDERRVFSGASLTEMQHTLYSRQDIKEDRVFLSSLVLTYQY